MAKRRAQGVFALLMMVVAFVLVAIHASVLEERAPLADRCPFCAWGHSLAVEQTAWPAVAGALVTGQVVMEPEPVFCVRPYLRLVAARAPPSSRPT